MNKFTLNIKISGITCDACVKLITKRVGKLDGATDIVISQNSGETIINSTNKLNISDIASALSGLPYQVKGE